MLTPIFSSFIYVDKLDINNLDLQSKCYQLEKNTPGILASNEGGWQSPASSNDKGFEHLFSEIRQRCNEIHKQLGFKTSLRQEVGNYWININRDKDSNTPHAHPGAFFSGVYYVKASPAAGAITFMHPVPMHPYTIPYGINQVETSFNASSHLENPEPGKLVIFPSWLLHFVQPNRSGDDRISIAFNTVLLNN